MFETAAIIAAIESLAAPAIATLVVSEVLPFVRKTKHNGIISVLFSIVKAIARELAEADPAAIPKQTAAATTKTVSASALPFSPDQIQALAQAVREADPPSPQKKAGPKRGANGKFVKSS